MQQTSCIPTHSYVLQSTKILNCVCSFLVLSHYFFEVSIVPLLAIHVCINFYWYCITVARSFTCNFSLVSKSPIAVSATQHPISDTDFLHHLDYHVPPLHPPVVLHFPDLLLACHIRCSTLVSKRTFFPGPFLHSFSE